MLPRGGGGVWRPGGRLLGARSFHEQALRLAGGPERSLGRRRQRPGWQQQWRRWRNQWDERRSLEWRDPAAKPTQAGRDQIQELRLTERHAARAARGTGENVCRGGSAAPLKGLPRVDSGPRIWPTLLVGMPHEDASKSGAYSFANLPWARFMKRPLRLDFGKRMGRGLLV